MAKKIEEDASPEEEEKNTEEKSEKSEEEHKEPRTSGFQNPIIMGLLVLFKLTF